MAAARWWARGGKPPSADGATVTRHRSAAVAADLALFGAPAGLVARWAGADQPEEDGGEDGPVCLVRPDCWRAVRLFVALSTQWQWVSLGLAGAERTGLRYESLPVTAGQSGIPLTRALFGDLRVMEAAALAELADMATEQAAKADGGGKPKTKRKKRK